MLDIALALLCRYPDNIWLNFLNNFCKYDIFVFIDNISQDFVDLFNIKYSNIRFVQMTDNYCKKHGYHNALIPTENVPHKPLSWVYVNNLYNVYDYNKTKKFRHNIKYTKK
jgi:hypothetical protein